MAYDFSLKRAVIEVDRDADRRWSFATDKMKLAEDKDEVAPNPAPLEDFNWAANCRRSGESVASPLEYDMNL